MSGVHLINELHKKLANYEPKAKNQPASYAEALSAFSDMVKARRMRVNGLDIGIPSALWLVIIGGEGAIGLMSMAQGAAMQSQINFTRMEEAEADRVGIGFLSAAGFDPNGMASAFSMMNRAEGAKLEYYKLPDLLRSHPVTTTRIAEERARDRQALPLTP